MTTRTIEPPPTPSQFTDLAAHNRALYRWLYEVYRRLEQSGLLDWDALNFTGSSIFDLADIKHRHNSNSQGGPIRWARWLTAINYTLTDDDVAVQITAAVTITLPLAAGRSGKFFILDNNHAGLTTVNPSGAETIEGEVSQVMSGNCAMIVYSDGTNWRIH